MSKYQHLNGIKPAAVLTPEETFELSTKKIEVVNDEAGFGALNGTINCDLMFRDRSMVQFNMGESIDYERVNKFLAIPNYQKAEQIVFTHVSW